MCFPHPAHSWPPVDAEAPTLALDLVAVLAATWLALTSIVILLLQKQKKTIKKKKSHNIILLDHDSYDDGWRDFTFKVYSFDVIPSLMYLQKLTVT